MNTKNISGVKVINFETRHYNLCWDLDEPIDDWKIGPDADNMHSCSSQKLTTKLFDISGDDECGDIIIKNPFSDNAQYITRYKSHALYDYPTLNPTNFVDNLFDHDISRGILWDFINDNDLNNEYFYMIDAADLIELTDMTFFDKKMLLRTVEKIRNRVEYEDT